MRTTVSRKHAASQGVALVTTVIVVAVLAVVAVAFMQSTTVDRLSSRSAANYFRAKLAAEAGAGMAQSLVASLLTNYPDSVTFWQNIGGGAINGTNNEATVLYVRAQTADTNRGARPSQYGGEISILARPLVSLATNRALFTATSVGSALPLSAPDVVNLNATNESRPSPLIGLRSATNAGAPVTAAQWIYLTGPDGRTNARFAFWVEDESFKVNANVAGQGPRGAASSGSSPGDSRLDGAWQSSSNTSLRGASAANAVGIRASLPGGVFPSAATAGIPAGVSGRAAADELRFLTSVYSAGLNLSRGGFKRFNLNTITDGISGPLDAANIRRNLDRFIAVITNSNSIPNFGQRFYRLGGAVNALNAVPTNHAGIYLNKIAANVLDYVDGNDQPTVLNNDNSFSIRAGRPDYGIEPLGGGNEGSNSVAAVGVENVPRLQEYAIHGRIRRMQPFGYRTSAAPPDPRAAYEISIDHYFEFWNPGIRDITLNNAFLKIYDQPSFGQNITGALANEGRPTREIPVDGVVFPAGRVTVLTTAPVSERNSMLLGANTANVVSLDVDPSDRIFSGTTRDVSINNYAGFDRLFRVVINARSTGSTDYESAMLLGNSNGILESFMGLPISFNNASGNNRALHFVVNTDQKAAIVGNLALGNQWFVRGGSLRGNSSVAVSPSSTEGDPRALNEQLDIRIYEGGNPSSPDQTRFYVSNLSDTNVPAQSTIGAPNANYVRPANWVDYSSLNAGSANAPLIVRNGAMQSIGELGHVTDPARVPGTIGSLTSPGFARGGGRTLRLGQPELPGWFDRNQTNASRTWASWRLADVFSTTSAMRIPGAINPNGVLRDNGAALQAALFGMTFSAPPEGAPNLSGRAANVTNLVTNIVSRLTNGVTAGLGAGAANPLWERGELSELTLFDSGTALAGVNMSNTFDRGREELVRRSIEMMTLRGSVFTVYAVGEALLVTNNTTNVLSSARVKTTFEFTPLFANTSNATNDAFVADSAGVAGRFVAPTNYQIRVLQNLHD